MHSHALSSLLCLSSSPSRSEAVQRWTPNGQHGSQHTPSSDELSTPNRLHHLQPSAWTIPARTEPAELRPDKLDWGTRSRLREVEKSRGWQASEELTYNKPIDLLSIRLSFLDFIWNELGCSDAWAMVWSFRTCPDLSTGYPIEITTLLCTPERWATFPDWLVGKSE